MQTPYCLRTVRTLVAVTLLLIGTASAAAPTSQQGNFRPENIPEFTRPLRVPDAVPLGQAKPSYAIAGETGTWQLEIPLARTIPQGQALVLEISGGRHNKGVFGTVQSNNPSGEGYTTVRLEDGTPRSLSPLSGARLQAFRIEAGKKALPAGSKLIVTLGDTSGGSAGAKAPEVRALNKYFVVYCPKDKKAPSATTKPVAATERDIVGACVMHVLGGEIDHLHAYVPAQCRPDQGLELLVRPEDRLHNLSQQQPQGIQTWCGSEPLAVTVTAVEKSPCVRVRFRIPSEGIHRIKIADAGNRHSCLSNPTQCRAATPEYKIYWGAIHGHTELSDGWGTLDNYYRQMRDECLLDFGATSDHDHPEETLDAHWAMTCQAAKRWNQPGRFVSILGYEWARWTRNGNGDRNVYYLEDDQPMYRSAPRHSPETMDLYKALEGKKAIVIPHHPAGDGNFTDYNKHDVVHERLIEIHQMRGSYECSEEQGNPLIARIDKAGNTLYAPGFVRNALAMGWRAGFTAGGDDHQAAAGSNRPDRLANGTPISEGMMAVLAKDKTREAIFDALWNRRVIATSEPRVLLEVDLNGHPIGSELNAATESSLKESRRIRVAFHGTSDGHKVEIIRNNIVVHTTGENEFSWEDKTPLADALLPSAKFCDHPFCFYYVRVIQSDGNIAWASPIWIDP